MSKNQHNKKWCPFWSSTNRRCTVSRNGIFIPLEDYISNFCTSEKHTHCHLYKDEMLLRKSGSKRHSYNRRKHSRFPAAKQLILHEIDESGRTIAEKEEYAYAKNLSAGGMQIQTKCPLFLGTLLNFTFRNADTSNYNDGLAEVAWCHYQEDSLIYLAGLSFQDKKRFSKKQGQKPRATS